MNSRFTKGATIACMTLTLLGLPAFAVEASESVLGTTTIVGNRAVILGNGSTFEGQVRTGSAGTSSEAVESPASLDTISADAVDGVVAKWSYYRDKTIGTVILPADTIEIASFAFARSSLTYVDIPESVTTIDYAAFYHCDNLSSVSLPNTVTSVGAKAFAHTAWVEQFLTEAEEDYLISGGVLIAYRGSASTITIPDSVRVIADEVFLEHTELEQVNIPVTVTEIGENTFPEETLVLRAQEG